MKQWVALAAMVGGALADWLWFHSMWFVLLSLAGFGYGRWTTMDATRPPS